MNGKSLAATLYLKNGEAVKGFHCLEKDGNFIQKIHRYNDSGIDKLLIFDLSEDNSEHDVNLYTIKEICRIAEIPVCAGGHIDRVEDIKKLLYAGCGQVLLNSRKKSAAELAKEGGQRFGKDKIAITLQNVDILFKHRETITKNVSEMYIMEEEIVDTMDSVSDIPYTVVQHEYNLKRWTTLLKNKYIQGICGNHLNSMTLDVMALKASLNAEGIATRRLTSALEWKSFRLNEDGLIPVIVQDYQSLDVLMLAYMNQEAFEHTMRSGKMTYYSRSRKQLWVKGETSGHFQYMKSLTIDCDSDTILAKVSQLGAACHTGEPSCFFQTLVKKEYLEKNPQKVFESLYEVIAARKQYPKEGSYTNYLFDKGIDKILKKLGEEATEIVIAAKNPITEEIKYEISDFLYHMTVLMVEKGVTWEDITMELSQR
ncbi:hypothetical protein FACS1894111_12300 [Clostridia bacterium]|nr:hypothetical protein FACS1894111_12300 [Clostridia bacterium]